MKNKAALVIALAVGAGFAHYILKIAEYLWVVREANRLSAELGKKAPRTTMREALRRLKTMPARKASEAEVAKLLEVIGPFHAEAYSATDLIGTKSATPPPFPDDDAKSQD